MRGQRIGQRYRDRSQPNHRRTVPGGRLEALDIAGSGATGCFGGTDVSTIRRNNGTRTALDGFWKLRRPVLKMRDWGLQAGGVKIFAEGAVGEALVKGRRALALRLTQ
jgi:hypothetical protein